ncbi:hypothetical protein SSX86_030491 [Deinandra increscens subsp. villosa]|uniref:F-box domain-containing protein n=1 Tax=Deinandra increscens subsp. villosa TaxID=3103831 RepID=A0AAP0C5G7_9ASTR
MSCDIPLEIQVEIIKRLPVKSLIQFRSVSKAWKSMIDSSRFIADHYRQQTHPQHLFVSYEYADDHNDTEKFVSYVDDDTFTQHKVSVTLPQTLIEYDIIGCSHGLLCLSGGYRHRDTVFLWNISIRKGVAVVIPKVGDGMYKYVLGLPQMVDICVYNLIISFDIMSEEFGQVNLPSVLALDKPVNLSMSKLRESLVVLQGGGDPDNSTFVVWMMEDGVPQLFTKIFKVNVNTPDASVKGFRMNGAPIVEVKEHDRDCTLLIVYESYSKRVDNLGIDGKQCSSSVYPYVETLLLLDQPNMDCNDM